MSENIEVEKQFRFVGVKTTKSNKTEKKNKN